MYLINGNMDPGGMLCFLRRGEAHLFSFLNIGQITSWSDMA